MTADPKRPSRLRFLLYAVVLAAVVPYGAVMPVASGLSTTFIAVAAAVVLLSLGEHPRARWLTRATALTAAAAAAYVVWQSTPSWSGAYAPPIWDEVAALLPDVRPTLSVAPAASLDAIGVLVAPFAVFVMALTLARTDDAGDRILRTLAWIGTAIAVFGFLQRFLAPKYVLFAPKIAYFESLTAVFVNRNTTATLLGAVVLLQVGLLAPVARSVDWRGLASRFVEPGYRMRPAERHVVLLVLPLGFTFLTLLLTLSRGGIAATMAGLAVLLPLLQVGGGAARPEAARERGKTPRRANWLVGSAVAWIALALLFLVFGGRVLMRMQIQGTEDPRFCAYPVITEAAERALPFGTGFATFEDVYPSIRDPGCAIHETWERAHNVFLEGALGLGWPFAALAAVVVAALFAAHLRGLLVRRRYRWAGATGLSVVVLVALHGLVDFSLQIHGLAVFVAALVGATAGLSLGDTGLRPQDAVKPARSAPQKPVRDVSRRAIAAAEAARLARAAPSGGETTPAGAPAATDTPLPPDPGAEPPAAPPRAELPSPATVTGPASASPEAEPVPPGQAPGSTEPEAPATEAAPAEAAGTAAAAATAETAALQVSEPAPTVETERRAPSAERPSIVMRGVLAALCLGLAAHTGPRLAEDIGTANIRKVSAALWGEKLIPADLIQRFAAATAPMAVSTCRANVARPALRIQLANLELQDPVRDYEAWEKAMLATKAGLEHILACNPLDGDAWVRLALVEREIADNPARIVRLAALSVRTAPYETGTVRARFRLWALLRRVHYEAAEEAFVHDLRVALMRWPLPVVRDVLKRLPDAADPYVMRAARDVPYRRALQMAREWIELPRPRL